LLEVDIFLIQRKIKTNFHLTHLFQNITHNLRKSRLIVGKNRKSVIKGKIVHQRELPYFN
jgi:hypothetical protein